jgi:hypothetical protein
MGAGKVHAGGTGMGATGEVATETGSGRVRPQGNELAEPAVRALLGSCAVDGGATDEQRTLIGALAAGYFGLVLDLDTLEPLTPAATAAAFGAHDEKHRLVETMILLELARHPASAAQTELVEEYAAALEVDNSWQSLARDYLAGDCSLLAADYGRFAEGSHTEPALADVAGADLPRELRSLGLLPEGTLGRAFFDFYQRHGLAFPGDPGGGSVSLVAHDMSHVLAGYEPTPPEEIALQAMLASACDGKRHFSGLMASLGLFEIGMLPFPDITPKQGVLARPGAAATVADAVRRGAIAHEDFATIDHWAILDQPLVDLRHDLRIVDRRA